MRRKLIILLAVFAVLALALGFFVFQSASGFSEAGDTLQKESDKFHRLIRSEVFPSAKNAQILGEQAGNFDEYLADLREKLAKASPVPEQYSRDRWQSEFGNTIRGIVKDAHDHGVALPAPNIDFFFGFESFRERIPAEADLNRLFPQLHAIASLCHTLFEAPIAELVAIRRERFEDIGIAAPVQDEESSSRRRGRRGRQEEEGPSPQDLRKPFTDPDNLFIREHFVFEFLAKDEAIWKVLESFAQQETPFVVVTRLDIVNPERPAIVPPRLPEASAASAAPAPVARDGFRAFGAPAPAPEKLSDEPPPRHLRKTAGRELPKVILELDVYRFIAGEPPATTNEDD